MKPSIPSENASCADSSFDYPASPFRFLLLAAFALFGGFGVTHLLSGGTAHPLPAELQAESIAIISGVDARISEVLVQPGQVVTHGTPLIQLADDDLAQQIADTQQQLVAARAQLQQAQAGSEIQLAWRQKELQDEAFRTRIQSAQFLRDKLASQIERIAWQEFLSDRTHVASLGTPDEVFGTISFDRDILGGEERIRAMLRQDAAENAIQVHDVQLKLCDERLAELARLEEKLPERVRIAAGVDVAEARVQRFEAELKLLQRQQQDLLLKATAYGTVGTLDKHTGDYVHVGDVVLHLLDEDRRFLLVKVPTRDIAKCPSGSDVRLRFPGGEKRQGRIGALPPQAVTSPAGCGSTVTIRIEPAGKAWPELPIGTTVEVLPPSHTNL